MSLFCLGAYFVVGLLFTLMLWMCLMVGQKHDEKKVYPQMNEPAYGAD